MKYYVDKNTLDYFILNDVNSRDLDIVITKISNLSSPEKRSTVEEVAGRNGDVFSEDNSYRNFKLEIEFAIDATDKNIVEVVRNLKMLLHGNRGYQKLVLSSDLEFYYEAKYINSLDIEEVINELGIAKLAFSCKPFKRMDYQSTITITESSKIHNEYLESSPKLKIFGSGNMTLYVNNQTVFIKDVIDHVIIDTENYDCYKEDINGIKTYLNSKMQGDFPILEEGENNISWIGTVSKIEIVPNWVVL